MANPEEGKKPTHHKKHLARLEREQQQTRLILYTFVVVLAAVVGLISYGYIDQKYLQPRKPVAQVGGVSITTEEFQARVRLQRRALTQQYQLYQQYAQYGFNVNAQLNQLQQSLTNPEKLGGDVLDQMVDEEIIRQEAAKRGITVSADDIDKRMHEIYQYYPGGTYTPTAEKPTSTPFVTPTFESETLKFLTPTPRFTATPLPPTETATLSLVDLTGTPAFTPTAEYTATPENGPTATITPTELPSPTATPYTIDGYKQLYQETLDTYKGLGISEEQYRKLVETDLLRQKLYEIVTADVKPEQEEVWARHILVNTEDDAKAVIDRLNKGEDFATVAKEVSKDPGSATSSGDLGWFGKGIMVASFEDAAFALKVGEISQPVKSDFGYHIIQLLGRQMRPISDSDLQKAKDAAFLKWVTDKQPEYNVQKFDLWKQVMPTEEPAQPA